jgi:TusA-related sulfurtransferase
MPADSPAPVIVDARGLMPPEPLNLTLEALDTLPPDGEVILLLYREPGPLYDILRRNGYVHRTETNSDGEFSIHIRHATAP